MLISFLKDLINGTQVDTWKIVTLVLSSLFVIFLCLPLHEAAHAFTAHKLGDNTAKYQGRLSLNPLVHIDPIGALMLLFIGYGYARPVPINPRNFKSPKHGMAISAAAGPVSNLLMAFIWSFFAMGTFALSFSTGHLWLYYVALFFDMAALINVSLALFNLIPIPPLDGSRILSLFLPERYYFMLMQYEKYSFMLLLALFWTGIMDGPFFTAVTTVYGWINYLPGKIFF